MYAKTDLNFLKEFHQILYNQFSLFKIFFINASPNPISNDRVLELLLKNNGCGISDDCHYNVVSLRSVSDYYIYFIYGAAANQANDYFDYIEIMGTKNLVIFMDYFSDLIRKKEVNKDDAIDAELDRLMGRSVYFDAIKKLTDIFTSTITVVPAIGALTSTSAANAYRFAGVFIAADIIGLFGELTENDISYISFEDLKEMMNSIPMNLLLLGAKYRD